MLFSFHSEFSYAEFSYTNYSYSEFSFEFTDLMEVKVNLFPDPSSETQLVEFAAVQG